MEAVAAYRSARVAGANPAGLVRLLLDRMLSSLAEAEEALRGGDVGAGRISLGRTQRIAAELLSALNPEAGELADHLKHLYVFIIFQLDAARAAADPEKLAGPAAVVRNLRDAWAGVEKDLAGGKRLAPGELLAEPGAPPREEALVGG